MPLPASRGGGLLAPAFMSLDVPSCPKRKGAQSLAIRSVNTLPPIVMEAVSSSSVVAPPPDATEERPRKQRKCELHVCMFDGCGKSFAFASRLASHIVIHSEAKPYACEVEGCGKSFAHDTTLLYHTRTHSGDKPYACKVDGCGYYCTQSSNLKKHTLSHHTERGIQRQKKREEQVARFLTEAGVAFERETSVSFCGEANKKCARIDFTIYYNDRVVCLEVDEFQHTQYGIGCDVGRMLNVAAEHFKRNPLPLHFIRYNPDAWTVNGTKQKATMIQRHHTLLREILTPLSSFAVTYVFYDATNGVPTATLDSEFPADLRDVCRLA